MLVLGDDPAAGEFQARRRLGYLPENVSFNMALTARETLNFYASLKGVARSEVSRLLERVELVAAAGCSSGRKPAHVPTTSASSSGSCTEKLMAFRR